MPSPATHFSKLSLDESMPPTTRSQSQQESSELGGGSRDPENDSDRGDDYDDDIDGGPVRSPTTNLLYNIDSLEDDQKETIRELFRQPSQEETPQMVLEWCGFSNDPNVYGFKMHEVVHHSIRIGSPTSRIPFPRCSCMVEPDTKPCKHLIWLMDLVTQLAVTDHNPDEVLELNDDAFPQKLGSPFTRISDFHIDVLADSLHCDFGPSDDYTEPNPHRVREIREILAAIDGYEEDVDNYRPEYFEVKPIVRSGDIVSRGELSYTMLRLLISNDEFFSMFLKLLSRQDKARDPYRKLKQRIERVLNDLKEHSSLAASASGPSSARIEGADIEGPRNVAWAASHIIGAVKQIHTYLSRSEPAEVWERASAAHTLVWILKTLVLEHSRDTHEGATLVDRNLYQRLIGHALPENGAIIVDTLHLIPDQNQHIDELEHICEKMTTLGHRDHYMRRLKNLIDKQRKKRKPSTGGGSRGPSTSSGGASGSGGGAGSKRPAAHDRGAKRVR